MSSAAKHACTRSVAVTQSLQLHAHQQKSLASCHDAEVQTWLAYLTQCPAGVTQLTSAQHIVLGTERGTTQQAESAS